MSNIIWTDDLNVGIDSIDIQHRHIVNLFNTLNETYKHGEISRSNALLSELIDYKLAHFTFEEDLLKKSDYPLYKMHRVSHELLTNTCLDLHQRAESGEFIVHEAIPFLRTVLVRHMKGEDADYAIYLREAHYTKQQTGRGWLSALKRAFK